MTVSISGSGGGFQKFCIRETDISDASREINDHELDACLTNGIVPIELVVGLDGTTVVANAENDFASCLTTDELRRIWQPGSEVTTWSDVRSEWPDEEIELYGPGADSGTFDYLMFAREALPQVGYVPLSLDRYRMRLEEIRWRAEE